MPENLKEIFQSYLTQCIGGNVSNDT
jgi:hypothetical protein